jgi:hypothetical protein
MLSYAKILTKVRNFSLLSNVAEKTDLTGFYPNPGLVLRHLTIISWIIHQCELSFAKQNEMLCQSPPAAPEPKMPG